MQTQEQDPVSYRVAVKILDFINSKVFWYVGGYICLFALAYTMGKFSAVSFSKYASNLLKQKKKLASVQRRMHQLRRVKGWTTKVMIWVPVIFVSLVGAKLYLSNGSMSSIKSQPFTAFSKVFTDLYWPLLILVAVFFMALVMRRVIAYWKRNLMGDQEETKHVKDNFIKSLFHELGDDITDSIFQSIGQDLMLDNKDLMEELKTLKETANVNRREIIVKRTYAESYADFMQALGSFNWCSNCMKPLVGKSLRPSPSGTDLLLVSEESSPNPNLLRQRANFREIEKREGGDIIEPKPVDEKSKGPSDTQSINKSNPPHIEAKPLTNPVVKTPSLQRSSSFLVCHKGCLAKYLNHVEQLKKKMKEQHAEIAVLSIQLEYTLESQLDDDKDFNDPPSKN